MTAPVTGYPAPHVGYAPPPPWRQSGRLVFVILVAIAGVVEIGLVIGLAIFGGTIGGAALSLLYALIPVPFFALTYWWFSRVVAIPGRYLWAAFIWGGSVAVILSVAAELAAAVFVSEKVVIGVIAPFVEEAFKGLFLVLTLVRARRVIGSVLDGLVMAGMVAVGFAAFENFGYYMTAYVGDPSIDAAFSSGAAGTSALFLLRGVFTGFAHPLFTSITGMALGLAAGVRPAIGKVAIIVGGYFGAVALHATWNSSLVLEEPALIVGVYLILGLSALSLVIASFFLRHHQNVVLRRSLEYIARYRGWLHPGEVYWVVGGSRRRQSRTYAASVGGDVTGKILRDYQRMTTELGFLYDRIERGQRQPHGVERINNLLARMYQLRPWLRMPQAPPPGYR